MLGLLVLVVVNVDAQACYDLSPPTRPSADNLSVPEIFKKYAIVGDYISKPPEHQLKVFLSSDVCNGCKSPVREVTPGDRMSPIYSFVESRVHYPNASDGDLYSVFHLDIDHPTRPKALGKAYINGMFVNCPGKDLSQGDLVVPYSPATPAVGSGEHRFIGLLYKQRSHININTKEMWRLARERVGFSVEKFAKYHQLDGPLAGNFFRGEINSCE